MKKSTHSKKIAKQLKKEYKEDLEKSGCCKQDIRSGGTDKAAVAPRVIPDFSDENVPNRLIAAQSVA